MFTFLASWRRFILCHDLPCIIFESSPSRRSQPQRLHHGTEVRFRFQRRWAVWQWGQLSRDGLMGAFQHVCVGTCLTGFNGSNMKLMIQNDTCVFSKDVINQPPDLCSWIVWKVETNNILVQTARPCETVMRRRTCHSLRWQAKTKASYTAPQTIAVETISEHCGEAIPDWKGFNELQQCLVHPCVCTDGGNGYNMPIFGRPGLSEHVQTWSNMQFPCFWAFLVSISPGILYPWTFRRWPSCWVCFDLFQPLLY